MRLVVVTLGRRFWLWDFRKAFSMKTCRSSVVLTNFFAMPLIKNRTFEPSMDFFPHIKLIKNVQVWRYFLELSSLRSHISRIFDNLHAFYWLFSLWFFIGKPGFLVFYIAIDTPSIRNSWHISSRASRAERSAAASANLEFDGRAKKSHKKHGFLNMTINWERNKRSLMCGTRAMVV